LGHLFTQMLIVYACAPQNVRAELVNIADNIRQHFVAVEVDSMLPRSSRS